MAAFSPQMKEFGNALDMLYIRNNASGRNKFKEKWPDAAQYLFGAQLIQYDYEGAKDLDHRAQLEEEAIDRRILLKDTLAELVDKSVDAGTLQFDYVGQIIDTFGPLLSVFLYAEDIIERVRPGLLTKAKDAQKDVSEEDTAEGDIASVGASNVSDDYAGLDDRSLLEAEKEILSSASGDDLDDIKPIDVSEGNTGDEMMAEAAAAEVASISPQAGDEASGDAEVRTADAIEENVADVSAEIAEAMQIKKEAVGIATFEDAPPTPEAMSDPLDDVKPIETPVPDAVSTDNVDATPSEAKAAELPPSIPSAPEINDLDDVRPIETSPPPPPPVSEDVPKAEDVVAPEVPESPPVEPESAPETPPLPPAVDVVAEEKPDVPDVVPAEVETKPEEQAKIEDDAVKDATSQPEEAVQPPEEAPSEEPVKVESGVYKALFNSVAKAV